MIMDRGSSYLSSSSAFQEAPIAFEYMATQEQEVLGASSEPNARDPWRIWPFCG